MPDLSREYNFSRLQRRFLQNIQELCETNVITGGFAAAMYTETALGDCYWSPEDIDIFVFTRKQFTAVKDRYMDLLRMTGLSYHYCEWHADYNADDIESHPESVTARTSNHFIIPTLEQIFTGTDTFIQTLENRDDVSIQEIEQLIISTHNLPHRFVPPRYDTIFAHRFLLQQWILMYHSFLQLACRLTLLRFILMLCLRLMLQHLNLFVPVSTLHCAV